MFRCCLQLCLLDNHAGCRKRDVARWQLVWILCNLDLTTPITNGSHALRNSGYSTLKVKKGFYKYLNFKIVVSASCLSSSPHWKAQKWDKTMKSRTLKKVCFAYSCLCLNKWWLWVFASQSFVEFFQNWQFDLFVLDAWLDLGPETTVARCNQITWPLL